MSTRSLTRFYDERGKEFACMYRHSDGYPSGAGADLTDLLMHEGEPIPITNGISMAVGKCFNGMGCLAAAVVAGLKDGSGGIYLYAPGTNDVGEEYTYNVRNKDGVPEIEICGYHGKRIIKGDPVKVHKFCKSPKADDDGEES